MRENSILYRLNRTCLRGTIRYRYEGELSLIQGQQNMFGGTIRYRICLGVL